MTLLHLVSEQRLQNLIPLLALEPTVVIQVLSGAERFAGVADDLEAAVAELLAPERRPRFERLRLESVAPSILETQAAVAEVLKKWGAPAVVNITGGTKLMSIGAHLAAEAQEVPSLYFDRGFHSAGSAKFSATGDIRGIIESFTVRALLAAHSVPASSVQSKRPSEAELAFGRAVAALDASHHDLLKPMLLGIRAQLYPGEDNKPIPKSEIDRVLASGLPVMPDDRLLAFYETASAAGFLRSENGGFHYAVDPSRNSREKLAETLALSRNLVGGWFELQCVDEMERSGNFVDLQTGVQAKGTRVMGETDIVAVERSTGSMVFVSCKADDEALKPLEHVFSLRQRAREFGGSHARAVLRLGCSENSEKRKTLEESCRALGVELRIGYAPMSADLPRLA